MSSKVIIVLGLIATFSILLLASFFVGYGANNYLFQDGSTPLTGDWDVGDYTILRYLNLEYPQDYLWFFDDFLGDQVKDEWFCSTNDDGTALVVDGEPGGAVNISVSTQYKKVEFDWNSVNSLLTNKSVTMECRARLSKITEEECFIRLLGGAGNLIMFFFVTGDGHESWRIRCYEAPNFNTFDTGVSLDTDYHIYRIESHIHGGSHVHFFIDGIETDNSPVTTYITSQPLEPSFRLDNVASSGFASLIVDYIVIVQDR